MEPDGAAADQKIKIEEEHAMKQMRRGWSLLMAILMLLTMVSCSNDINTQDNAQGGEGSSGEETIVFQAGHVLTEESAYHRALVAWSDRVYEETNGHIKIEVFPNSTLGNERDMIESVQLGLLDITLPNHGPMANFTDVFEVFDLPFLFASREEAYAVCDSEFGQGLLDSLRDINIVGLSMWENGVRYISNNVRPVLTPDDLDGLKIRTMENNIHMASFRAWGADPTAMAWGEVYTGLQQKTIDGLENTYGSIYQNKIHEVSRYFTETGHFFCAAPLIMSEKAWNQLTEEEQQILIDTANEVKALEREWNIEDDVFYKEKMIEEGAEFIDAEDVDKELWREASQPVYDEYASSIGQDVLDEVQAIIDSVRK